MNSILHWISHAFRLFFIQMLPEFKNEIGELVAGKKRIIIVGASSGIGKEMASQLALDGHVVAITGRRAELLEEMRATFTGGLLPTVLILQKTTTKNISNLS